MKATETLIYTNTATNQSVSISFLSNLIPTALDEVAKEVIDGKWGNGKERKKKLSAEGYDWKAVQKRVNELLK